MSFITGRQSEYKPFENRDCEKPNTVTSSRINLIKGCLGTGVLAMPAAFKNTGLLVGTLGIIVAGVIVTHAMHVLVKTSQDICVMARKPSLSFAETCGGAFTYGPQKVKSMGGFVTKFTDVSLTLCYFGVLCIYVVFIAESFKQVFDGVYPDNKLSIAMYCVIILPFLILICQLRNLRYITPFSAIANIGIIIVFCITLKYVLTDLPSPASRKMAAHIETWPVFLSMAIFAMEGIGVVMPVENEMAEPAKFLGCPGVLVCSMVFVGVVYGVVGFLGYTKYGEDVKGSITLNLPQDGIIPPTTKIMMAIVIFFTYTLQFYVPMETVSRRLDLKHRKHHENLIQIGSRTIIVTLSVIVAALVPNLEVVIALVGSIFFATCGIILPFITETVFRWDKNLGPFKIVVFKNFILIIIGLITLVVGSTSSIASLRSGSAHSLIEDGIIGVPKF